MKSYEILIAYENGTTERIVYDDYSDFFTKTDKLFNDGYNVQRLQFIRSCVAICTPTRTITL